MLLLPPTLLLRWRKFSPHSLLLSLLLLLLPLPLIAKRVSRQEAFDIARKYITPAHRRLTLAQSHGKNKATVEPFYVFNGLHGKGFVIVAGDDAMGEVLAYSDTGALDTTSTHPGVRLLLETYREGFDRLQASSQKMRPTLHAKQGTYQAVRPLLSCEWDQVFPYNKNTGYPYTGCVATAMAQLMFFHKWPEQGKGEMTYTVTYDQKEKHVDFTQSHYDWAHMKDIYNYYHPSTDIEKEAVAQLMSDVGVAAKMQYSRRSSGAFNEDAERAFQNHFDYTTAFVKRSDEGTAGFTEIVRQELLNGFPVYLSGYYRLGADGHSWVTDGMDERGLFHMNFGWGGQSNGYFSLTAADVAQSGNEFGGRPLSFKVGLMAILAHPNKPGTKAIAPSLLAGSPKLYFTLEGSLTLPEGHRKTFAATEMPAVEMTYFINKGKSFKGDVGVGIYDMEGKLLKVCPSDDHERGGFTERVYGQDGGLMKKDYFINTPQKIQIDLSGFSDGYYQLLPICVPKQADGSWGDWGRMKLSPRMVLKLNGETVRVSEENYLNAGFQLTEQPALTHFQPGQEEKVYFSVRNKGGLEQACYAKLQLLDADGKVALEVRREQKTEFAGFDTTLLPFTISIPDTLQEGKYAAKLELIGDVWKGKGIDDPNAKHYAVGKVNAQDDTFFVISSQVTRINTPTSVPIEVSNNGNVLTIRAHRLEQVELFDLNGHRYISRPAQGSNELTIPVISMPKGTYLLKAVQMGRSYCKRVFIY